MATKKNICKFIRREVKKLPPDTYKAAQKYDKPIVEKGEDGKFRVVAGEWIDFPINHARRAKRMYKKEGLKGLSAYFLRYGFKLIKNASAP